MEFIQYFGSVTYFTAKNRVKFSLSLDSLFGSSKGREVRDGRLLLSKLIAQAPSREYRNALMQCQASFFEYVNDMSRSGIMPRYKPCQEGDTKTDCKLPDAAYFVFKGGKNTVYCSVDEHSVFREICIPNSCCDTKKWLKQLQHVSGDFVYCSTLVLPSFVYQIPGSKDYKTDWKRVHECRARVRSITSFVKSNQKQNRLKAKCEPLLISDGRHLPAIEEKIKKRLDCSIACPAFESQCVPNERA